MTWGYSERLMVSMLTADQALKHLLSIAPEILTGVILSEDGRFIAGEKALTDNADQLFKLLSPTIKGAEVHADGMLVFALRSQTKAIVVIADRSALPSLMIYDLKTILKQIDGGKQ